MIRKVTMGFVVQSFNDDGSFVSQDFIAGDEVEYETHNGDVFDESVLSEELYHPFNMEQS